MNKSESIKALAQALSKAQAEMPTVKFNAKNPFLKNRYADLGAIIEASKPILAKHGLSVSQFPISTPESIGIETILMHESGEWMSNETSLHIGVEKGKSEAQVAGSIITYLRRYSLSAVLGIYADEDGDGNDENTPQRTQSRNKVQSTANAHKNAPVANSEAPDVVLDGVTYSARLAEVVTGTGERYIDCDDTKLSFMKSAIEKRDTEDGADHMDNKIKLAAIAKISELRGTK